MTKLRKDAEKKNKEMSTPTPNKKQQRTNQKPEEVARRLKLPSMSAWSTIRETADSVSSSPEIRTIPVPSWRISPSRLTYASAASTLSSSCLVRVEIQSGPSQSVYPVIRPTSSTPKNRQAESEPAERSRKTGRQRR